MPNVVVGDDDIELARGGQLVPRGGQPNRALLLGLGAAADEPAHQLLPARRLQEDEQRLGHGPADLPGALQVDLEQGRPPGVQGFLDGPARRAVLGAPVHHRPLQELPRRAHPLELGVVDEVVVDALDLTGPRVAGGRRHRQPHLREVLTDVCRDGPLAHGGRTGQDDEPALVRGHGGRDQACSNRASSAAIWLAPRPRTRRLSEMPTSSMIWRARTRPTPGMDSSSAETFILPTMSSFLPSAMTSDSEPWAYLRRFLTAARSRRALAAFSRASARCSGVSGGRATVSLLERVGFRGGIRAQSRRSGRAMPRSGT